MTDIHDLDTLLSRPLPVLADEGFSDGVMRRIARRESVYAAIEWSLAIAIGVLVVLFVPARGVLKPLEIVVVDLGMSLPFAVACSALVLTQAALRLMRE